MQFKSERLAQLVREEQEPRKKLRQLYLEISEDHKERIEEITKELLGISLWSFVRTPDYAEDRQPEIQELGQ